MKVRLLGTHNLQTSTTRHTCFLVDDVLAIDAGSLMSSLDSDEADSLRAVMLTHHHFDHIRDIPTLGLVRREAPTCIDLHGLPHTLENVRQYLMDGNIYPDMTKELNGDPPRYRLCPLDVGTQVKVQGYEVTPISMPHPVPSIGYLLQGEAEDVVAFTGDTSGNLMGILNRSIVPRVLFVDMTFPDRMEDVAEASGHLTPSRLRDQLSGLLAEGIRVPPIVAVHRGVGYDKELVRDLEIVARDLGVDITPGYEGMVV